jgi:hypothetical protein
MAMTNLAPPPSGPTFEWQAFKDWLYKLWRSVTGATFGADSSSYSSAIMSTSGSGDGQPVSFSGAPAMAMLRTQNGSGQSIPSNTLTTLTGWGAPTFDTGNGWNASTGTYTIPVTGYYLVSFVAMFSSTAWLATEQIRSSIAHNGTNGNFTLYDFAAAVSTFAQTLPTTFLDFYNVGDTITFQVLHSHGSAVSLWTDGNFTNASITQVA